MILAFIYGVMVGVAVGGVVMCLWWQQHHRRLTFYGTEEGEHFCTFCVGKHDCLIQTKDNT
jgi:hypothetical protein